MSESRTVVGKFIHTTWTNLNIRCSNGKYYKPRKKNECYRSIELRLTRDQFKNWCLDHKQTIESLDRPSIDRIDKNEHYVLSNIQVIELAENIRKDKTVLIRKQVCALLAKSVSP
jgi:hypothetical protein